MVKDNLPIRTIRIKSNLIPVIKTENGWRMSDFNAENVKIIVDLFKAHNNFNVLLDSKNKNFLKGFLINGNVRGERINILPDGRQLDKAFSLFSPHLTIHDQTNHSHWDVIYQNPNGDFAYLYSLDKVKASNEKKYEHVREFSKIVPRLKKNLLIALKNNELMALPLYTLLKTYMRVGNEIYYKLNGHKGLTTLKKQDIKINKPKVKFNFIGKSGVPQETIEIFPESYIFNLLNKINLLKKHEFVFTDEQGKILKDTHFECAFEKYCGKRFYPHIVRSYYATKTVEDFLLKNKNKKPTKTQINDLYNHIAEKLGHKKFSKKENIWKPSHTVTVAHYISPKLVGEIDRLVLG